MASTVATKPFMAGATPSFASAGVVLTNETTGALTISSELLALGQPIIRAGEKGKEARATLALSAQGTVRIGLDLATGHVSLLSGQFVARDVERFTPECSGLGTSSYQADMLKRKSC